MEIFLQLILAAFLGGILGLERESKGKEAGLRTYTLVCLGAAFFTVIGFNLPLVSIGEEMIKIDPTRIIQAIAAGIGFIGAGLIIHRQHQVEGLTTAAGLWVAAGVGVAVGAKLYLSATFVTFLAIGILIGLRAVEDKFFGKPEEESQD